MIKSTVTYKEVEPKIEGLKETGRLVLDALVSYLLIEGVLNTIILLIFKDRLSTEIILILTGALMSVLKGLDKGIHLTGKIEGNPTLTKGLAQF